MWHTIFYVCETYCFLFELLKKRKQDHVRIAVCKTMMKDQNKNYWKTIKSLRKNNYNSTSTVDGHDNNLEIANHFRDKFCTLFNSVRSCSKKLNLIEECISDREHNVCNNFTNDNAYHCHTICQKDVQKAIFKLKSNKIDEDGMLFSDNCIHGTELLYMYISQLFTAMICHGFAPTALLKSTMIPIPKGARANLLDSNMYRSIAISSLLCKILDNIIIERQAIALSTSDYQFGFKSGSSTVLCSTMVIETIQYYLENGGKSVYLVLLDASKAFDRVSYDIMFKLLLERNVCPRIIRLLYYMYTNQKCNVKWEKELSDPFNVSNGVKQGGVISPLLFSIYIDNLFAALKQLGLGCHVGLTYAGAFGYADDIALISPSIYGIKKMIAVCESYALEYHITFNPTKSKIICFNVDPSECTPIYLNNQPITFVNSDKHLGNYISSDITDRNIMSSVCDFYQRSNSILVCVIANL